MKIKVCGMKDSNNIELLLKQPIDFIGFIFYPKSKRYVGKNQLSDWINQHEDLFGEVQKVGVFVNAEIETLLNTVHDYKLDYVQLHGEESPEYCREINLLWEASTLRKAKLIKAFSVDEDFDFSLTIPYSSFCRYFIFDTKGDTYGGTGKTYDWSILQKYQGITPFFLSGGLSPEHVEDIKQLDIPQLSGLDINSRFEIEPGLKDIDQVASFVEHFKS